MEFLFQLLRMDRSHAILRMIWLLPLWNLLDRLLEPVRRARSLDERVTREVLSVGPFIPVI